MAVRGINTLWKQDINVLVVMIIFWQVNIMIWQVNIKIWQVDIIIWQVDINIWQVMAEICHHRTRVLKHKKDFVIKQFSKVDIKQNISTVILLIKILVYRWYPRHLQVSCGVYLFTKSVFYMYLITFSCISIIRCIRFFEFTDEKLKMRVQFEDGFIFKK